MLVVERRINEVVEIRVRGLVILVRVTDIRSAARVKLGIVAPAEVQVVRPAETNPRRAAVAEFREEELGGVLGADGTVYSDADPGL